MNIHSKATQAMAQSKMSSQKGRTKMNKLTAHGRRLKAGVRSGLDTAMSGDGEDGQGERLWRGGRPDRLIFG